MCSCQLSPKAVLLVCRRAWTRRWQVLLESIPGIRWRCHQHSGAVLSKEEVSGPECSADSPFPGVCRLVGASPPFAERNVDCGALST